mmetsp:Transcript_24564/g.62189  ORF Transcript_24564/g.62189 Transcript_24564/m.62189 type:complete len:295 (-) Transcript_24564:2022-2906(-)
MAVSACATSLIVEQFSASCRLNVAHASTKSFKLNAPMSKGCAISCAMLFAMLGTSIETSSANSSWFVSSFKTDSFITSFLPNKLPIANPALARFVSLVSREHSTIFLTNSSEKANALSARCTSSLMQDSNSSMLPVPKNSSDRPTARFSSCSCVNFGGPTGSAGLGAGAAPAPRPPTDPIAIPGARPPCGPSRTPPLCGPRRTSPPSARGSFAIPPARCVDHPSSALGRGGALLGLAGGAIDLPVGAMFRTSPIPCLIGSWCRSGGLPPPLRPPARMFCATCSIALRSSSTASW